MTPAYYDITITGKGLRDEESAEMLDIILKSTVYDLRVCMTGNIASGIQTNIIAQKEFASFYAKREKHAKRRLKPSMFFRQCKLKTKSENNLAEKAWCQCQISFIPNYQLTGHDFEIIRSASLVPK